MGARGFDNLEQKLKQLKKAAQRDLISAAQENARFAAAQAQRDAPRDTGHLQNSIRSVNTRRGAYVVADTDYAWFVEHGTYRTPAQPFFEPAMEKLKRDNEADFRRILRNAANGAK